MTRNDIGQDSLKKKPFVFLHSQKDLYFGTKLQCLILTWKAPHKINCNEKLNIFDHPNIFFTSRQAFFRWFFVLATYQWDPLTQPFKLHTEKWFWGWRLRFSQVTTLNKIWVFRTRFFSAWQPEFFLIYGINPAFFQGEGPTKSKPEFFLGFETNPDF